MSAGGMLEQQSWSVAMNSAYLKKCEAGKAAVLKATGEFIGICLLPSSKMPQSRHRGRRVSVITMGEVYVRAAADVVERKKVLAMPDGGLTCPKRGRRRNGAIDMHGAMWLTTTAKGEMGRIVLRGGMRAVPARKVSDVDEN
jgi:hypothetical protein